MKYTSILILCLSLKYCLSIKVIVTPKFQEGPTPSSAFTRIKNVSSPALVSISSCCWSALDLEDIGSVWATRNTYFGNSFKSDAKYMYVGKIVNRFQLPADFVFIPERWTFFCFSFDNSKKLLNVYFNGEMVLKKIIKKHLENYEIKKNFLENEKFGNAYQFAGKYSDLNIWSTILSKETIRRLHDCEKDLKTLPDVLNWEFVELDLGTNITSKEEKDHPCIAKEKRKTNVIAYAVNTSMEPKEGP